MIPENVTISPTDLAWAAGLIDGEGCIGIYPFKSKTSRFGANYQLALYVRMTHEQTVNHLRDIFNVGSVHHTAAKQPRRNDIWAWTCYSKQAIFVIEFVKPYLVTKAAEAQIAVEFRSEPTYSGYTTVPRVVHERRKALAEKMYQLKRSQFRSA